MIRIKKDNVEINVTKGAYENFYKDQGFNIVGEPAKEVIVEKVKDAVLVEPVVKKKDDIVLPIEEEQDEKDDFEAFILNELKAEKDEKVEKVEKPKSKKGLK